MDFLNVWSFLITVGRACGKGLGSQGSGQCWDLQGWPCVWGWGAAHQYLSGWQQEEACLSITLQPSPALLRVGSALGNKPMGASAGVTWVPGALLARTPSPQHSVHLSAFPWSPCSSVPTKMASKAGSAHPPLLSFLGICPAVPLALEVLEIS